MYVEGPYKEWADVLNDLYCGDPEPVEERIPDVRVGDKIEIYWCYRYEETRTVTEEDIAWLTRMANDPENDTWSAKRTDNGKWIL